MGYGEAIALARIRHELRERLMTGRHEGAEELLERLFAAAGDDDALRCEYARWRLRFDLLSATCAAA